MEQPEIIFEDDTILVCYKPAGFATQTSRVDEEDMVSYLANYRAQKGESPYIGLILRLDQPVEGVLVFAKTKEAAADLSRQMHEHLIEKKYYAIVTPREGLSEEGEFVDYILKDSLESKAKIVLGDAPRAKKALLKYQTIRTNGDKRLLDISLHTGRFHQIRVQFAGRKAPILGDKKYGGVETNRMLALCAYRVTFLHPKSRETVVYQIEPKGEDFKRI